MEINVGIYSFPEMEVLDFAGPYEVFTTATRVADKKRFTKVSRFSVFSIASSLQPVRARAGLQLLPDYTFENHPKIDVLIIPGGVITAQLENVAALNWVNHTAAQALLTASVCTGVFVLAQAGVLTTQSVTTHWEDIADLKMLFPKLHVVENTRWVDAQTVVSSAGISAGIDMSLYLVQRLANADLAHATARQMEFDWLQNSIVI